MKEIPILFSTPMVQAILDGRKTMTRRIVKTKRSGWDCQTMKFALSKIIRAIDTKISSVIGFHAFFQANDSDHKLGTMCHYGQPGDVLWVRETWRKSDFPQSDGIYEFKATMENPDAEWNKGIWKPSIHMPKAAARIWLQVEEIRVERLHDISEEDAMSEGVQCIYRTSGYCWMNYIIGEFVFPSTAKYSFMTLWKKINGNDWNIGWDLNPWVWVVKFKTLSTTGKPQMCYKTNEVCKYDCKGLCRESM